MRALQWPLYIRIQIILNHITMKNFAVLIACSVLISCSKDADIINSDLNQQNVAQLSVNDAFKVGEVDANGNANITYNITELSELSSCAVSEDIVTGIIITNEVPGYYLGGLGTSPGSTTSFKVELIEDGSNLYWQDGAHIAMCQSSNATPCTVCLLASESFTCQNGTPNACNDDEIGGGSGDPYTSCGDTDWPWATTDKDKK
jgi:hypothetical protein